MRAVIQRVKSASVEVDGEIVSRIGPGLCVFVGLKDGDSGPDVEFIGRKILNMRLFENADTGKAWDRSVMDMGLEVLLVSQFTLYGILKGNKPDFHHAMPPSQAREAYENFVEHIRKSYSPNMIKDGVFGAKMDVAIVNDGPVTYQLDSKAK
mmetsp:Transcript_3418/g.6760  ORF Transcript_3418/g.6760 Transcript_3418/m.6760 type:complete len:152 (-) Transcript_3418:132-587(-)|eukprot:CAMPEP_0114252246 /NCGR_PEP_ID=MMETSP0058-20121206/15732_1 /TAXON_ID=36894 /ORGANISM="Pyramimonas parkeae, CCMP726" /LENGTH=151 /DNA_ID=CAMNT_0001366163 /DNA_START=229 /DNA_END=684 /DNA_ORIENTATION=+